MKMQVKNQLIIKIQINTLPRMLSPPHGECRLQLSLVPAMQAHKLKFSSENKDLDWLIQVCLFRGGYKLFSTADLSFFSPSLFSHVVDPVILPHDGAGIAMTPGNFYQHILMETVDVQMHIGKKTNWI